MIARSVLAVLFAAILSSSVAAESPFVRPGDGVPKKRPVWGHRDGIQVGISPTLGPHGLLRIFAPHVGVPYPNRINYLSIEPTSQRHPVRDQSELAISRERNGRRGLQFLSSNSKRRPGNTNQPATGVMSSDEKTLRVFIHTEAFPGGALPIIEVVFQAGNPEDVQFRVHQDPGGEPMSECVLSATMGNYAMVREVRLPGNKTHIANQLWRPDEEKDYLNFFPWRSWKLPEQMSDDRPSSQLRVSAFSDTRHAKAYPDSVPNRWRYSGR